MIVLLAFLTVQDDVDRKVARLVERLSAESVVERDEAQKALVDLGEPAIPALERWSEKTTGEVRDRIRAALAGIRAALREVYRERRIKLLPERWRDVWFAVKLDGGLEGYFHIQLTEEADGFKILENASVLQHRDSDRSRLLGWTSEVLCKRDRWLTPRKASCTTRVDDKKIMKAILEFGDEKVRSEWTIHRNDRKVEEVFDPPKTGKREKNIGASTVLQTAALPFYSLFGGPDESVGITFIEFPDDLDEDFTVKAKRVEYVGSSEIEVEGKKVLGFRYRAPLIDEFTITKDGHFFPKGFRRVTEKEAKAVLEK